MSCSKVGAVYITLGVIGNARVAEVRKHTEVVFFEPRHFWLCASVCAAAIAVVLSQGGAEPAVRLVGLVLQLLGIVTVVWGIVETREFFGMQSPLKLLVQWLSRFPLRRRTIAVAVGEAVEANDALSVRGHKSWPIDPTAPLEQRVSALERNLPLVQERISNFQTELDRTAQALNDQLRFEQQHRLALSHELQNQLKTYGTGGLHISAIGAAWVFLGTVFGTASIEISVLLK